MVAAADRGLNVPYQEKAQAGLVIEDRDGQQLFWYRSPRRVFDGFADIPPIVVDALLYLENRELLNPRRPSMNPAVEWDRFTLAALQRALRPGRRSPGGSTLATQVEKFRHSPSGVTHSGGDKLRQMVSASLRAYQPGEKTLAARQQLVVDYTNSIPLAAFPGLGAVFGLADSLHAWYGADIDQVKTLLRVDTWDPADPLLPQRALAYKQVLSLYLSQKRPTYYLRKNPGALQQLADAHLRRMLKEHAIPEALAKAALPLVIELRQDPPPRTDVDYVEVKAGSTTRGRLLRLFDLDHLDEVDQLDLRAATTLDREAQEAVALALRQLGEPGVAAQLGLKQPRLLAQGDPAKVIYSLTLYEQRGGASLLRVQADSLDQPLDLNEGMRLELGSTAKLRTLITYLEIVAELHARHHADPVEQLTAGALVAEDRLTQWALTYLASVQQRSLDAMLEAAMVRKFSCSPAESFFTGGGVHRFSNFDSRYDGSVLPLRQAFEQSVNLPFIRVMQEVVRYHSVRLPAWRAVADRSDPARAEYLARFVDTDARAFLTRFFRKYQKLKPEQHLDALVAGLRPKPKRLAAAFVAARPGAGEESLGRFLAQRLPDSRLGTVAVTKLYRTYSAPELSWADKGYLTTIHPLELWLVEYLHRFPRADLATVVEASREVRGDVYRWLFKTNRRNAQDVRIRTMLEAEAFAAIHGRWQRLGFPFAALVPSYASAIGSSGDRPAALAELVGILLDDGVRTPRVRVHELHFAAATPYETRVVRAPAPGVRVLPVEVARAVRKELLGVVQRGTAQRTRGAFSLADGHMLEVGGKTGTGDNRHHRYGPHGQPLETVVLNRTATFAFFIGDRLFGTIVAYVPGQEAGAFNFTSALPTTVLKQLAPALAPVVERAYRENE